jgi:hypothetical protein
MTINDLIVQRAEIKSAIDNLNSQLKDLRTEWVNNENLLIKEMDGEGLTRTANDKASVSINEDVYPEITDWDEFCSYVSTTQDFSFFHRRISTPTFREGMQLGQDIPGLKPRTVRRLNMRKL